VVTYDRWGAPSGGGGWRTRARARSGASYLLLLLLYRCARMWPASAVVPRLLSSWALAELSCCYHRYGGWGASEQAWA
jgi:hypothetical protein